MCVYGNPAIIHTFLPSHRTCQCYSPSSITLTCNDNILAPTVFIMRSNTSIKTEPFPVPVSMTFVFPFYFSCALRSGRLQLVPIHGLSKGMSLMGVNSRVLRVSHWKMSSCRHFEYIRIFILDSNATESLIHSRSYHILKSWSRKLKEWGATHIKRDHIVEQQTTQQYESPYVLSSSCLWEFCHKDCVKP